jgi:hypothetical protein
MVLFRQERSQTRASRNKCGMRSTIATLKCGSSMRPFRLPEFSPPPQLNRNILIIAIQYCGLNKRRVVPLTWNIVSSAVLRPRSLKFNSYTVEHYCRA